MDCTICQKSVKHFPRIPCGHTFHFLCLEQWFDSNKNYTCPNCRQSLTVDALRNIASNSAIKYAIRYLTHSTDVDTSDYTDDSNPLPSNDDHPRPKATAASKRNRDSRLAARKKRIAKDWNNAVSFGAIPFGILKCRLCLRKIHKAQIFIFSCGHCYHIKCAQKVTKLEKVRELLNLMRQVKYCTKCMYPSRQDVARLGLIRLMSTQ